VRTQTAEVEDLPRFSTPQLIFSLLHSTSLEQFRFLNSNMDFNNKITCFDICRYLPNIIGTVETTDNYVMPYSCKISLEMSENTQTLRIRLTFVLNCNDFPALIKNKNKIYVFRHKGFVAIFVYLQEMFKTPSFLPFFFFKKT
jgi:hypothetical protein